LAGSEIIVRRKPRLTATKLGKKLLSAQRPAGRILAVKKRSLNQGNMYRVRFSAHLKFLIFSEKVGMGDTMSHENSTRE
jgi:hypothetical protein